MVLKRTFGAETVRLLNIYFLAAAFFGVFTFLGLAALAFFGDLVAAFLGFAAAFLGFAAAFLGFAAAFLGVLAFLAAGFLGGWLLSGWLLLLPSSPWV